MRAILAAASFAALFSCRTSDPALAPAVAPSPPPLAAAPAQDEATLAFARSIESQLQTVRYMEGDCAPAVFPSWEGLPLQRCNYEMRNGDGEMRRASVIMLNPGAAQLARWIFSACRSIDKDDADCRRRLFQQAMRASGAQFPVAGVVLEDINPRDGAIESYTFRGGVTVKLEGVPNGTVRQLTDPELAAALSPDAVIRSARRYARIVSTSPDDWRAAGGLGEVGTTAAPALAWPEVAGAAFRAAWGVDENALMNAWARAHAASL